MLSVVKICKLFSIVGVADWSSSAALNIILFRV